MDEEKLSELIYYVSNNLRGYEKGEAQIFLDILFKAFGHEGVFEANASLEFQMKLPTAGLWGISCLRLLKLHSP